LVHPKNIFLAWYNQFSKQTRRKAYDYCCSIGMRLAEFGDDFDEMDSVAKQGGEWRKILSVGSELHSHALYSGINLAGVIGEVYVNGQFQDVWCDSHVAITKASMYYTKKNLFCETVTCYFFYSATANARIAGTTDFCLPDSLNSYESYFLCA
jgi:hypothetical protein